MNQASGFQSGSAGGILEYDLAVWLKPPPEVTGPGNKFNPDGTARRYRGNTVISYLVEDSILGRRVEQVRSLVAASAAAARYSLLPPSSWHMTVIQLLCEERRSGQWSSQLASDCPLDQADVFIARQLALVSPPAADITMRYRGIRAYEGGLSLQLEPADDATARALRRYRDDVAGATGVRLADHDSYVFHVGIGYRIAAMTAAEAGQMEAALIQADKLIDRADRFQIDPPGLTFFNDMLAFPTSRAA